jgi:hypothetical protein
MGAANEVSFSCDARRLLGAGADKRLLVWNTATGQVRELTGGGGYVPAAYRRVDLSCCCSNSLATPSSLLQECW